MTKEQLADIHQGDTVRILYSNVISGESQIIATVTKCTPLWIIANTDKFSRKDGKMNHSAFSDGKIIEKL